MDAPESQFPTEPLPRNAVHDAYFGDFLTRLKTGLSAGGSELGLGLTLFSLAASIRARRILEIGRFKGFSTLALGSALRFLHAGWDEPQQHRQRPDVDYADFESAAPGVLFSIDPHPTPEAERLVDEAGLRPYVRFINHSSQQISIAGLCDLMFIDGDHSYQGCKADVARFVPKYLRPGGYFILHDYYGWYDAEGTNRSPIKQVVDELVANGGLENVLIDTGYMSFVIFRRPAPESPPAA